VSSAGKDPNKKHRHDVGEVAHGAATQERTTAAIQSLLALWVVATAALTVYALYAISTSRVAG